LSPIPNPETFRRLPSVDELLKGSGIARLVDEHGRTSVVEAIRAELEQLRAEIGRGIDECEFEHSLNSLPQLLAVRLSRTAASSLRRVINASGVVLHTNLGRAPLSAEAIARVAEIAGGYSNLEFDLGRGERGRRDEHVQPLFAQLFAREGIHGKSTLVVNNNAAAVLLALTALAQGGEVIVSRGELVEIGGSFRIPDIMAQSGAVLREVGTTNRTRLDDYKNAISERTRLLLRVHRSNFEIVGFTEQPAPAELTELARQHRIPLMEDLGSGALVDLEAYGIRDEPNVYASMRAGASLVTFSGDKLLGGPQAGVIAGEPELIERMRKHPLFRALRVDKLCYAALGATLAAYLREQFERVPLLQMLRISPEEIRTRCESLAASCTALSVEVTATQTLIGGGAAPGKSLASFALALRDEAANATELARALRQQKIPIVGRAEEDRVLLDLRTVDPKDDSYIAAVLAKWTRS
jgi:L-seryl-tRNA(Ser) seleniumtransferase